MGTLLDALLVSSIDQIPDVVVKSILHVHLIWAQSYTEQPTRR